MDVRIFSPGGSGYKFFKSFLNKHTPIGDFSDEKHNPHTKPKKRYLKYDKIIYIYADPEIHY